MYGTRIGLNGTVFEIQIKFVRNFCNTLVVIEVYSYGKLEIFLN